MTFFIGRSLAFSLHPVVASAPVIRLRQDAIDPCPPTVGRYCSIYDEDAPFPRGLFTVKSVSDDFSEKILSGELEADSELISIAGDLRFAPRLRRLALDHLSVDGPRDYYDQLLLLKGDENAVVRYGVMQSIYNVVLDDYNNGQVDADSLNEFKGFLEDPIPFVRHGTALGLADIEDKDAVPLLVEFVERWLDTGGELPPAEHPDQHYVFIHRLMMAMRYLNKVLGTSAQPLFQRVQREGKVHELVQLAEELSP